MVTEDCYMKVLRYILIAILLCFSAVDSSGANRALLVCIGDYPDGSGWKEISSARDKVILEDMLLRNGFRRSDINVLQDSNATVSAIKEALRKLSGECRKGDVVYVHFSCHGQQVTDLNGDEPDGWDEALIPYDARALYENAGYHGQNHLLDDDINLFLSEISKAVGDDGLVLFVSDACHSGDNDRDDEDREDPLMRGIYDRFVIPGNTILTAAGTREENGWVRISACREYQNNYEIEVGNTTYGRLSYALSRLFCKGQSVGELVRSIEEMYDEFPVKSGRPRQRLDSSVPESMKDRIIIR